MDEAFRFACSGDTTFLESLDDRIEALAEAWPGYTPTPGREATEWTVETAMRIDDSVITAEELLHVEIPGLPTGGTADMLFPTKLEHGDMKSGRVRNYMEQMAAYSLGFMDRYFTDRWRAHLLFSDQREIVTHDFTYREAEAVVQGIRAEVNSPMRKATPNEYCGWCVYSTSCHARQELATRVFAYTNIQERWEAIKDDPEELAAFLMAGDCFGDFLAEGKAAALAHIESGTKVEGFKRVSKVGNEFVDMEVLVGLAQQNNLTTSQVIRAFGSLSGSKARTLFKSIGATVPDRVFQRHGGSVFLSKNPVKKAKATPEEIPQAE
jgi:hypothetical protein